MEKWKEIRDINTFNSCEIKEVERKTKAYRNKRIVTTGSAIKRSGSCRNNLVLDISTQC